MNLRKNMITALLIAVGFIIHQVVPGTIGGVKFDLMLSMLFVCLLIQDNVKNTFLTGALGGLIAAFTTSFPGGQIPNIIDKLITCFVVFAIIKIFNKYKNNLIFIGILAFVGTLISGSIFLSSASVIVGLPAGFGILFTGIVLPAAVGNIVVTIVIYKVIRVALKATGANYISE